MRADHQLITEQVVPVGKPVGTVDWLIAKQIICLAISRNQVWESIDW